MNSILEAMLESYEPGPVRPTTADHIAPLLAIDPHVLGALIDLYYCDEEIRHAVENHRARLALSALDGDLINALREDAQSQGVV